MRIANLLLTATLSLTRAVRAEEAAVPPCQVQSVALDGIEIHSTLGTHDSNAMPHWISTDKTTRSTKNKTPKLLIHGSKRAKYFLTKLREEDVYNYFFVSIGNSAGWPTYPAEVQISTKPLTDGTEEVEPVQPLSIGVYAIWTALGPGTDLWTDRISVTSTLRSAASLGSSQRLRTRNEIPAQL